jgi:hypothetical protein
MSTKIQKTKFKFEMGNRFIKKLGEFSRGL